MSQNKQTKIDPLDFRRTLGRFASGVTVITTRHEGQTHGMTANAFVSVSLEPPLVLVSIDNRARMLNVLQKSGWYGVSILSEEQEQISQHFAGRPKEEEPPEFIERAGVPLLEGALAHLVCEVVEAHLAGDHTLYIGRVEYLDYHDGHPLLFYTGGYRNLEVQISDPYLW